MVVLYFHMKENPNSHENYSDSQLKPESILQAAAMVDQLSYCADFISRETYDKVFDKLKVRNITMLDVGAGIVPVNPKFGASPYFEALKGRNVKLVPIEHDILRIHTWKLINSHNIVPGVSKAMPVQADVNALPFRESSVDGAISVNYINSFKKNAKESVNNFLEEIYRALKPGGFLIISTFGYTCQLSSRGDLTVNDKIPFNEFVTPAMVKELAKKVGFSKIEDVPLDKEDIERSRARWVKQDQEAGEDVTAILMEDPIGLLLKK